MSILTLLRRTIGTLIDALSYCSIEKKQSELMIKLNTVKLDKKKITKTIGELDNYKNEALLKTWRKVDA